MVPLPNPRYERKFIADGFSLADAVALVRRHRAAFHEAYPPRTVNNIYLDSPSRSAYYDHINGASQRVKHRVRWYGALDGPNQTPVLERKLKSGSVSGKDAHGLPVFQVNGQALESCLAAVFDSAAMPERLKADLHHLVPCLINQYQRHYFVSADGYFRLTLDTEFRFGAGRGTYVKVSPAGSGVPSVVLELKYEPQHCDKAEALTNAIPFRMTRCSKFVLGVEWL
jgi:hypothetical protein